MWWGGLVVFWPNILSILVLIEIRIRIKTRLWQQFVRFWRRWSYFCFDNWRQSQWKNKSISQIKDSTNIVRMKNIMWGISVNSYFQASIRFWMKRVLCYVVFVLDIFRFNLNFFHSIFFLFPFRSSVLKPNLHLLFRNSKLSAKSRILRSKRPFSKL